MADNSKDNPDVWCLPIGLMQYHNHPQPRQIVQTKNLMLITYESNYGLRYIYLDGRPAPNNDPTPWWFGYSRGWWEGDTLVVETTNFLGDERAGWLDVNGSPYTDALKMTERFRRPNFGTLEIDITIDDPKAYTKPFTVRVNHRIMVDSGDDRVHLQREREVHGPHRSRSPVERGDRHSRRGTDVRSSLATAFAPDSTARGSGRSSGRSSLVHRYGRQGSARRVRATPPRAAVASGSTSFPRSRRPAIA